jgi:hypothetical protein
LVDKSTSLILDALNRAVADPAGVLLHGNRKTSGLFAISSSAKQLAQRCKDDGLLRVVNAKTKGKSVQETCAITEKGIAYLLSQVSPKQVLEELVRTLQSRQVQVEDLVSAAKEWHHGLYALQGTIQKVLEQIRKHGEAVTSGPQPARNGAETWLAEVLALLTVWQASVTSTDCPLPDLYGSAKQATPSLTIGVFHDGLRRLHDQEQIYLHPWTGPLYEIPEPQYALLIGHEIAYYASRR